MVLLFFFFSEEQSGDINETFVLPLYLFFFLFSFYAIEWRLDLVLLVFILVFLLCHIFSPFHFVFRLILSCMNEKYLIFCWFIFSFLALQFAHSLRFLQFYCFTRQLNSISFWLGQHVFYFQLFFPFTILACWKAFHQ